MEGWLTTWKQIAKYVGRSEQTAKRYHKKFGLPVLRGPDSMPFAIPAELDLWLVNYSKISAKRKKT